MVAIGLFISNEQARKHALRRSQAAVMSIRVNMLQVERVTVTAVDASTSTNSVVVPKLLTISEFVPSFHGSLPSLFPTEVSID